MFVYRRFVGGKARFYTAMSLSKSFGNNSVIGRKQNSGVVTRDVRHDAFGKFKLPAVEIGKVSLFRLLTSNTQLSLKYPAQLASPIDLPLSINSSHSSFSEVMVVGIDGYSQQGHHTETNREREEVEKTGVSDAQNLLALHPYLQKMKDCPDTHDALDFLTRHFPYLQYLRLPEPISAWSKTEQELVVYSRMTAEFVVADRIGDGVVSKGVQTVIEEDLAEVILSLMKSGRVRKVSPEEAWAGIIPDKPIFNWKRTDGRGGDYLAADSGIMDNLLRPSNERKIMQLEDGKILEIDGTNPRITCTYDILEEYGRGLNNAFVGTPIDEEHEGEEVWEEYKKALEQHGVSFPVQCCLNQGCRYKVAYRTLHQLIKESKRKRTVKKRCLSRLRDMEVDFMLAVKSTHVANGFATADLSFEEAFGYPLRRLGNVNIVKVIYSK